MEKVVEITDKSFEREVIHAEMPVEVDFWAPWCGPCRMVGPIYDKLAGQYDNFKFCKINVDENQEIAQQFGIQSIPMQMFFADGKKVDEILGAVPESIIRTKVDEVIRKYPTDEKSRLKAILSTIVENNKSSYEKFKKWRRKSDGAESNPHYSGIAQAVAELESLNGRLSQFLKEM